MSGGAAAAVCIESGQPLPLGLSETCDGFNLAVFTRHGTGVTLLLFDGPASPTAVEIPLDAARHRTGDTWHARLVGLPRGAAYALQVDGPFAPEAGHRFDPRHTLLDPYAAAVVVTPNPGGHRCLVPDLRFDWGDDRPPRHAWRDTVIYETHVRGLTVHPSSGVGRPGCFAGVAEMISYFQSLGITALELMPVQAAPALATDGRRDPTTGEPLRNYWGYDPVALFAPRAAYAAGGAVAAFDEFRTMVRDLHRAGIEVVLDVVFNHTAEGGAGGPTFSFRGLDNAIYYIPAPGGGYADYTGCGNTLNCNHPVVRSLIVDCLRHWVVHGHVDGFRFDLAAVLGRGPRGELLPNPPVVEQIAEDPILRHVKLIAEAWDSAGAFQVGVFPNRRWAEWNAHFRDDVRRFWRGDPGMAGALATRLCGSADLYGGVCPLHSVNFVTLHDGFTLDDLVSYARRHNDANAEGGRDGPAEEYSDDNGVEGASDDPGVGAVRSRQVRNLLATLFLSRGVPMLLGGDEFRRTQRGNSNAWCQDNVVSWYDWELARRNADLARFVRCLIAFRRAHPVLAAERFYSAAEIAWIGAEGGPPGWDGPEDRLGCVIREQTEAAMAAGGICLLFNAAARPARLVLPAPPAGPWRTAIDTAAAPPADIADPGAEPLRAVVAEALLPPRSTLVLVSRHVVTAGSPPP